MNITTTPTPFPIGRDKSLTPHAALPLETVLAQLAAAAARPFEEARPIPPALHHSPAFAERERERIFTQEWICIGRADEITKPGDYLTHEIAGVPIIALRQADRSVKAFVNACAHRFSRLLKEEQGSCRRVICPYHAWAYDLGGQLLRAPFMEMKQGFDKSAHRLKELHAEVWEGFLYVTLAETPSKSLAQALAPFTEGVVGRFDMACYQTVFRETMTWTANWKNLMENFIESYHVPMAHGKTFAKHSKPLTDYICGEDSDHYGYHRAPQPSDEPPGAAHPKNHRLEGEWRRMMIDFSIYPCHLITLMPDYLWYITVQPAGPGVEGLGKMRATWGVAFPPEVLADVPPAERDGWVANFKAYMEVANDEDKPLVEALYRGSASPLLPDGLLHPIERNIWQFTRYLNRLCGS
ncbi:MAG: SRPBCC family protein [Pseudomonadota bacterium]